MADQAKPTSAAPLPVVYAVIVNWNGWADVLECLETLLASEDVDLRVVVVDNASTDGSLDRLTAWAEGRQEAPSGGPVPVRPIPKPLSFAVLSQDAAEQGGGPPGARLVFVKARENRGFAAGCNIGMRHALAHGDLDYVWLLNPDTAVRPDTLACLVAGTRERGLAMAGSLLACYHTPGTTQAIGGRFNRWAGTARHVGEGLPLDVAAATAEREPLDYVVGASLLVPSATLARVGLMYEGFFLYYEEIDWALRLPMGARVGCVGESVVYHKEGGSTGLKASSLPFGRLSDRLMHQNRLRLARRHMPWTLPTVALRLLATFLRSAAEPARWPRARMFLDPRFWKG